MKQSQRRYFRHSACDCRECVNRATGFQEFGYALLVLALLIAAFGSLFVIAAALR
jgi:hypothetical protein